MAEGGGIFPLLNRDTPVMDRLRNGVGQESSNILSKAITDILGEENEENKSAIAQEAVSEIRTEIAEASDVSEEVLDGEFFDDLRSNLENLTIEDVMPEVIPETDEESEESEEQKF